MNRVKHTQAYLTAVFAVVPAVLVPNAASGELPADNNSGSSHSYHQSRHRHGHDKPVEPWRMYVQSEGHYGTMGAAKARLVLVAADGSQQRIFHCVSGPFQKGMLPGLEGTKYLRHPHVEKDSKQPNATYKLDHPHYDTGGYWYESTGFGQKHYPGKPPEADFWMPFTDEASVVIGRSQMGLHPNRKMPGGFQACTRGCIGIIDKDSAEFEHLFKTLTAEGVQPKVLEVYTQNQIPVEDIIVKRYKKHQEKLHKERLLAKQENAGHQR